MSAHEIHAARGLRMSLVRRISFVGHWLSVVRQDATLRRHLLIAAGAGLLMALLCWLRLMSFDRQAADFTWVWRGARELLAGNNPYLDPTIGRGHPYPGDAPLYYPLPALLLALPFAALPAMVAGALFFGLSCGLLVFGLLRERAAAPPREAPWRWALFLALPFWNALGWAQWSPLMAAAVLLPALLPLAISKPSLGLVVFAARPSRRGVLIGAAITVFSLMLVPSWPWDWYRGLGHHGNFIPLLTLPFGPLLLLAALGARGDWRARLLLAMAIVPQNSYDLVPLWLIPQTRVASMLLAILSWLAYFAALRLPGLSVQWPVLLIYLPVLAMVLRPLTPRAARPTTRAIPAEAQRV